MYSLAHVVFLSKAAGALNAAALKQLVAQARLNNSALGITGVLLHTGVHFLQVLEGNPDTVFALCARIARDNRHAGVTELVRETIEKRQFADCPLGYAALSTRQVASLSGATEAGLQDLYLSELNVGRSKRLLGSVASGHRSRTAAVARVAA